MAIPMSALRRALAEMTSEAGYGLRNAYRGDHVMGGMTLGGFTGGVTGGVADEMTPGEETSYGPAGFMAGAALGAAGGGGAKLAHMVVNAARGGERGFSRGLREALAEQAASRGMGRRAAREAADGEDAMRFFDASDPRSAQFLERMRARHDELASQVSLPPRLRQELNELRSLLEPAESQVGRATVGQPGKRGLLQKASDYIADNPTEVALAGAATGMGALGGGGLLAITGGMAAQYQRAQRATGIEDLSMMTPEELAVLGHPQLEIDPDLQAEAQQILMRHRKEAR